ncbi:unnamed protein product, partial [Rotaria socialis]
MSPLASIARRTAATLKGELHLFKLHLKSNTFFNIDTGIG